MTSVVLIESGLMATNWTKDCMSSEGIESSTACGISGRGRKQFHDSSSTLPAVIWFEESGYVLHGERQMLLG